jgi:hypothetical protein
VLSGGGKHTRKIGSLGKLVNRELSTFLRRPQLIDSFDALSKQLPCLEIFDAAGPEFPAPAENNGLQLRIFRLRAGQIGNGRILTCYLRGGVASIKTGAKEGFQPQRDASAGAPQLRTVGAPIVCLDRTQKCIYGADIKVGNCGCELKKSICNWPPNNRAEILRNVIEGGSIRSRSFTGLPSGS